MKESTPINEFTEMNHCKAPFGGHLQPFAFTYETFSAILSQTLSSFIGCVGLSTWSDDRAPSVAVASTPLKVNHEAGWHTPPATPVRGAGCSVRASPESNVLPANGALGDAGPTGYRHRPSSGNSRSAHN